MMKKSTILKCLLTFIVLSIISSVTWAQTKKADKCLVIVGAEHRYTQVTNTKESTQEVIKNINSVIEEFDSDNIIYVYSVHKALFLSLKGPKMVLDSKGMIRDERLNVINDNIITKEEVNAFENEDLIHFLQRNNTKDIVVVGFMADYYVQESLLGGNELAYNMYFIPEAIMGKSEKQKDKIFGKLMKKGINKLSINEI